MGTTVVTDFPVALLHPLAKGICATLSLSGVFLLLKRACHDPLHLLFFHLQVRSRCGSMVGDITVGFIWRCHQRTEHTSYP